MYKKANAEIHTTEIVNEKLKQNLCDSFKKDLNIRNKKDDENSRISGKLDIILYYISTSYNISKFSTQKLYET